MKIFKTKRQQKVKTGHSTKRFGEKRNRRPKAQERHTERNTLQLAR